MPIGPAIRCPASFDRSKGKPKQREIEAKTLHMETETQVCFGSNDVDISTLVDALADAIDACGLSVDWAPDVDPIYLDWYGYGDSGAWVHCSSGRIARDLAKSVAAILGTQLSLYESACALTAETGELSFQARTISAEGKVMPKASTALDDENLGDITAGKVRDRLSQLLELLKCCNSDAIISHSCKVFSSGGEQLNPTAKATLIRENRVQDILSEIERGISATLARYDGDTYEFVIQTVAGYPSTIYASVAEKEAVEAALTNEARARIAVPTVYGPLRRA